MSLKNLRLGIYGGLAGGLFFGALMGMMGMLPMIGQMVGVPSAAAGFAVHMLISAAIGAAFALLLGRAASALKGAIGAGVAYGAGWWLLGPLTLMPVLMGMRLGANWNAHAVAQNVPSLMGHVLFGAVLGLTYHRLLRGAGTEEAAAERLDVACREAGAC
jgi:hypothetical protein